MRLMRTMGLALTMLLASLPAMSTAQVNPALNQVLNPVLTGAERGIEDEQVDAASARLDIREFKADVQVTGRTATATIELLIATAQDADQDEARLRLVLPADAVITGYALDVEGKLVSGQLLEQPKARSVYQDEVRRGIDPGLAEVSAQNVFSTRIYPVTPAHPRRVRITFAAPFDPAKGFDLPLATVASVARFDLAVSVAGYAVQPEVRLGGTGPAPRRR